MTPLDQLAGLSLPDLRRRYHGELFGEQLPFWSRCGIDHELGGFQCSLGYDGSRVNDDKFVWFQGRGLWVWSFVYNHLEQDPALIEVARKTKDFLLQHFPQHDGSWASMVTREGQPLASERDVYGRYFAVEGLFEYAHAAGDGETHDLAFKLFKQLFREETERLGGRSGARPQGFWMVNINIATQFLRRDSDPDVQEIADRSIEAVIERHYNPDIQLNNEELNPDFTRPPGEQTKCNLGHSVETLWMVMEEARRRGDEQLADVCAERIHRHLSVGWDWIHGGLALWINVDQGGYEWMVERVPGTDVEFRSVGEYNYTKTLWSLDEVLIATLLVLERCGDDRGGDAWGGGALGGDAWAADYFIRAQQLIDEKFSMKHKHGEPTYVLFADRRITPPECSVRQDNYHRLRALALNLLTLDRMITAQSRETGPSGGNSY